MLTSIETAPRPFAAASNPFQPEPARVVAIRPLTADTRLFTLRLKDERLARAFVHRPGQFLMLSVPGAGEAPFSISSSPSRPGVIELCVRRVGRVTDALFMLQTGASVGLRGPYGNGFPVERIAGGDLLLIAGGLGIAPLRSLLWNALDCRERFGRVVLLYGARSPEAFLFKDEFSQLVGRPDLECLLTVDHDPGGEWKHRVGLLPELLEVVRIKPASTYAAVCGPPVVYRLVLERLLQWGFSKDRILMSLERRMKCGVGKCGHCSVGYKYTCLNGPIFTYWDAINLPEMV